MHYLTILNIRIMQLRARTFLFAIIGSVCLFSFSACKKDFSQDKPFAPVYTPTIYIGSQNQFLYAFDPANGQKKWEYFAGSNIHSSPLVMGDYVYVTAENGFIHKLDAKTGTLVKRIAVGGTLQSTPYGEMKGKDGNDYIYIGTGSSNSLIAYDVTADSVEWTFTTGDNVFSSPTIYDTLVVVGSNDGKVYGINKFTGVKGWEFQTGGPVISSPTVNAAGYVYVGSNDYNLYCLHVVDGTQKWQFATNGLVQSSPISYGGNAIFGSNDGNIYCVDTATAIARWKVKTSDRVNSSPTFWTKQDESSSVQVVLVGSYDYKMYAINILDGSIRWSFPTKAIITSSPLVFNDKVYFGSFDKYLYCARPDNGDLIWKQNINGLIECSPAVDNLNKKSIYTSSISGNSIY